MKPLSIKELKEIEALMTGTITSMLNDTCYIDEDSKILYQFDKPSLLKFMQLVTDITLVQVEIKQDERRYKITVKFTDGNATRYIYFLFARDFLSAIITFNTSSAFEGYELISIEAM